MTRLTRNATLAGALAGAFIYMAAPTNAQAPGGLAQEPACQTLTAAAAGGTRE